ncbi:MAG: adenylate/guanylate cyclase domain-containing protein [Rhodoferax sp.]|nr:adenylate/guanylate cyclase domain-containing protein [Rhodoferax sp.]MCF8211480.1 adenylate/guanylate cyclase domain-containing protein [Rhodoferax sp.]
MNRRIYWFFALTLMAICLSELVHFSAILAPLEQRLQDIWFQLQDKRAQAQHVVIVEIDESSLAAFPDEPLVFWTDKFASAAAKLKTMGAGPIGVDLLLSISPERWFEKLGGPLRDASSHFDQSIRMQINSGRMVLAGARFGQGSAAGDYLLPSPDYLLALPDFDIARYVGLTDLVTESDGMVRRFEIMPLGPRQDASSLEGLPSLGLPSLVALHAAGQDPTASKWQLGGQEVLRDSVRRPIPYLGPTGTFEGISLKTLLIADEQDAALRQRVQGKAVLLGLGVGLGDDHYTPFTSRLIPGRGGVMSGVEIHANVLEALLSGQRLQQLDTTPRVLTVVVLSAVATAIFTFFPAYVGVALGVGMSALAVLLGYQMFKLGTLVPVVHLVLCAAFAWLIVMLWRLTGEEKERNRLRQLFGRYVSDQVVTELLRSDNRPELGGTSQVISVLFSDIRNFTTISEKLTAKEVVEMLNTYFERACGIMLAQGGSIDKFIGDAIMVEFGSPLPVHDHALRAVKAAIGLAEMATEFAHWMETRFPDRGLPPFAVGIGIHSGTAIVGNIGSSFRMEYTAIGDTVNLASRLEGATKTVGCVILASEATVNAAGSALQCGKSDVIQVKGRLEPVRVFEILDVRKDVSNEI